MKEEYLKNDKELKKFLNNIRSGLYGLIYDEKKNPDFYLEILSFFSDKVKKGLVVSMNLKYDELERNFKSMGISRESYSLLLCDDKGKCDAVIEKPGSLFELSQKINYLRNKRKVDFILFLSPEKLLPFNTAQSIKRFFSYYSENMRLNSNKGMHLFDDNESTSSLVPHIWPFFESIKTVS